MNDLTHNEALFSRVVKLVELARKQVATAVNLAMVYTYFEIGRMIVEDQQQGNQKAQYGKLGWFCLDGHLKCVNLYNYDKSSKAKTGSKI